MLHLIIMYLFAVVYLIILIFNSVNGCAQIGDKTSCHESCETCDKQAFCGDETKCTNCPKGHNRILINENEFVFKCKNNCLGYSHEITEDNYICEETISNNVHISPKPESPKISASDSNYFFLVISGFIFILLIIAILFLVYALRKKKIKQTPPLSIRKQEDVEQGGALIKLSNIKPKQEETKFRNLEIITNLDEIKLETEIGSGGFSKVFTGTFRNQPVAIKMAYDRSDGSKGRKSILKELQIYDKIFHQHIVPALGIHLGIENMLILELRKQNLKYYFIYYGANVPYQQLKQHCIQIADGMRYLHSKSILHCDLKIDNILVKDDNGEFVEISDFGCAIDLNCDYNPLPRGTVTHRSYELLKSIYNPHFEVIVNEHIDTWAFGITAWQIFKKSHELPSDFINPKDIVKNYESGKMLPQPPDMPKELWRHIFFPCFNICPKARPSMEELYNRFFKFQ